MSLSKSGIPYLDFGWNPCGYGCSNIAHCPTCWAKAMTVRKFGPECPDCRSFKVHFHPERLGNPARRKKPAVIGVQFTGDLFDKARPAQQTYDVLNEAFTADWHTYVFLTQQPQEAHLRLCTWLLDGPMPDDAGMLPDNWFIGTTIKDDAQARSASAAFTSIPGHLWLSLEPLCGVPDLGPYLPSLSGIVIGSDNQPSVPIDVGWFHRVLDQVHTYNARPEVGTERPPVYVYVKQLWTWRCPNCGHCHLYGVTRCPCGTPGRQLLYTLVTEPNQFPESLRDRALPWTLRTK